MENDFNKFWMLFGHIVVYHIWTFISKNIKNINLLNYRENKNVIVERSSIMTT